MAERWQNRPAPGPAAAALGGAATTLISAAAEGIPDGKETFLVTTPSTSHWLDVWGTVWQPAWGQDGKI